MNSIGSVEYSGLLNQNPESIKINPQELSPGQQAELEAIEEKLRERRKDTISNFNETEKAKVKEEKESSSKRERKKKNQENDQEEGEDHKYITPEENDKGQNFDFSA